MAKYRVNTKDALVTIKSKLSIGERINERELDLFEKQLFRGCFRPKWDGKKGIMYTAPADVNMKKYLKNPLNAQSFFEIIIQILEMSKQIESSGLYLPNLVLNIDYVFINETTREMFFIYQPLISKYVYGNVYVFIEEIVKFIEKKHGICVVFLQKFKSFLSDKNNYRIDDVEEYIKAECPQAYSRIVTGQAGKSGFITTDRMAYAKHYQQEQNVELETTLLSVGGEETTMLCVEETTLLTEEHFPWIQRLRTTEKKEIRGNHFEIGKANNCDFVIADNKAISRQHVFIEKRNGSYYITDQNSTNHSYLNGKMLVPGMEEILQNKDVIRLADEEFCFEEG